MHDTITAEEKQEEIEKLLLNGNGGVYMENQEINIAARAAKNEYLREWRKKNPEKVKAAANRYWAKKAAQAEAAKEEKCDGSD